MKERESNIELLRILTIIGVIVLHYNNKFGGGALKYVLDGSINFYILNILESIFICAVNVFVIISGIFLYNTEKRNIWKVIRLLFQIIIIYEFKYIISAFISKRTISIQGILLNLIPSNYFVILYIVVYILSPYVNILIKSLNKKELKRFLLILLIMFSIYPTAVDFLSEITKRQYNGLSSIGLYGSQYGYSCVNFIMCYIIGAYISKYKESFLKLKFRTLMMIFTINVALITGWSFLNDFTGYFVEKNSLEYCNPLIIINAAVIIIIFSKINIHTNIIINKVAKASFMVYLIHDVFMKRIKIEMFVNKNIFIMILHIIISTSVIYIICYILYYLYNIIENFLFKKLEQKINLSYEIKKQENLSEKI